MLQINPVDFVVCSIAKSRRKPAHAVVMYGDEPSSEATINLIQASFDRLHRVRSASEVIGIIDGEPNVTFALIDSESIPADDRSHLQDRTEANLRLWILHVGRKLSRRRKARELMDLYNIDVIVPSTFEKHAFIRDMRKNVVERMLEQHQRESVAGTA